MFEKQITLPRCKGTVWLRTRLSDGRADGVDNAFLYRLPQNAMAALTESWAKATPGDARDTMALLAAKGFDAKTLLTARKEADRDVVRLVVKRWANVFDADGEPLELSPDAPALLDEDDFNYLASACYGAVAEGRADPNGGKGSSEPGSSPGPDTGVSPSTSETPSPSTSEAA